MNPHYDGRRERGNKVGVQNDLDGGLVGLDQGKEVAVSVGN